MNTTFTPSRLRAAMSFLLLILIATFSKANSITFLSIHCPDDEIISCLDETSNLSIYGEAYIEGYNGKQYLDDPDINYHLNICGLGIIERTWEVYDYNAKLFSCTQKIEVVLPDEELEIEWPDSIIELSGCDPAIHPDSLDEGQGYPVVINEECRFWGKTYSDMEFNFGTDCRKIIRSWKLLDWCTYRSNSRGQGVWKFTQVIKITNTEMPLATLPNDTIVNSINCTDAEVILDQISVQGIGCNQNVIISHNSPYAYAIGADASGVYPIGTTEVVFKVQYGCGLNDQYQVLITVEDKTTPIPLCVQKLAIALMPVYTNGNAVPTDGMVEIWAKDFDHYSSHPCDDRTLSYSFSSDINDMSRSFTCAEAGENQLELWVTDQLGNQSYCDVIVDIQNNNANIPNCNDNLQDSEDNLNTEEENLTDNHEESMVFGQVYNYYNLEPVENVSLVLAEESPDTIYTTIIDTQYQYVVIDSFTNSRGTKFYIINLDTIFETQIEAEVVGNERQDFSDTNGMYYFHDINPDKKHTLKAHKEDFSKDNINNDDLLSLYSHVMGLEPITDPYILLAADLNGSGNVDDQDVSILLNYLSNDIQEFPGVSAWILISEDQIIGNGEKSSLEDRSIGICHLEELSGPHQKANFIAIKRGNLVNTENETKTNVGDLIDALQIINNQKFVESPVFYPNPFSNQVNLKLQSDKNEMIRLQVSDLQGRIIHDESLELIKGHNEFPLNNLVIEEAGVYFYRIWKNNSVNSGKLIKARS